MLNDSGTSDSALKLRNSLSLLAADEPTSTTSIDFKLDDEDTENSEPFFDNDFLDETSQQSSNNPISQFTNASTARYPSTNSVESNQSSDTNNNLIASNPQAQQLIDQHLSFNNSINFNNGQNYSIVSSISTGNQIPIQNLLIKENLLYQNVSVALLYCLLYALISLVDYLRSNLILPSSYRSPRTVTQSIMPTLSSATSAPVLAFLVVRR